MAKKKKKKLKEKLDAAAVRARKKLVAFMKKKGPTGLSPKGALQKERTRMKKTKKQLKEIDNTDYLKGVEME